jgi:hypothetical protein
MVKPDHRDPRTVLDDTATSIKKLVQDLENREIEGTVVTAAEIRKIAGQLQAHVEDLLAASSNLRAVKSEGASVTGIQSTKRIQNHD